MSTCGCVRSRKICGAFGISSERSFTYTFSIENTGCWSFWGSLMDFLWERTGRAARARESGSGGGEQRVEAARAIERGEVVVAAHVAVAHVDLRHRAPAGALHHLLAAGRLQVDADLLDL